MTEKAVKKITTGDIRRKIEELRDELRREIGQPPIKFYLSAAISVFALTLLSYWLGKRRGKA
jgi:hypothetical protein